MTRRWVVAALPEDRLTTDAFALREAPTREPADGEVACRVLWLSIDAANRAWLQGTTYRAAVGPGDVMPGYGIGEITASTVSGLAPGDVVLGDMGWQEHVVLRADEVERFTPRGSVSHHLGVLGISGLTAHIGLLHIGGAAAGETVAVSAAAGATGSLAGQIARLRGCRVVGICGSDEKRRWLEDLGFDATVSHRSADLRGDLKRACPDGIDVMFDNVGGDVLEAALWRMNERGRIVCCGVVSQYDTGRPRPGPAGVPGLLVTRRLAMRGFIYLDHSEEFPEARRDLESWLDDGSLSPAEDVVDGLERAPDALVDLLAGGNRGKRLVRVAERSPSV